MSSDLSIKNSEDPETYGRLTVLKRRGNQFSFPNVAILPPPQTLEDQKKLKFFSNGIFEKYRAIKQDYLSKLSTKDKTKFYEKLRFTTRKLDGISTFNMLIFELDFFPNDIDDLTNTIYATKTDIIISPTFSKRLIMQETSEKFTTKYLEFLAKFIESAKFKNKREIGVSVPLHLVTTDDFKKILAELQKQNICFVVADFQGTGPFQEARVEKMHALNRYLSDTFKDEYFIYGANIRHPAHGTGLQKLIPAEEMFSVGLGVDGLGVNHIANYNPEVKVIDLKTISESRDIKVFNSDTYIYDTKSQKNFEKEFAELMSYSNASAKQNILNSYFKLVEESNVRRVLSENTGLGKYLLSKKGYSNRYPLSKRKTK